MHKLAVEHGGEERHGQLNKCPFSQASIHRPSSFFQGPAAARRLIHPHQSTSSPPRVEACPATFECPGEANPADPSAISHLVPTVPLPSSNDGDC